MNCDPTFVACQLDDIRDVLDQLTHPSWINTLLFPLLTVLVPIAVALFITWNGNRNVRKQIEVAADAEEARWNRQLQDRVDDRDYQIRMDIARRRKDTLAAVVVAVQATVNFGTDTTREEHQALTGEIARATAYAQAELGPDGAETVGRWLRRLQFEFNDFGRRVRAGDEEADSEHTDWMASTIFVCTEMMRDSAPREMVLNLITASLKRSDARLDEIVPGESSASDARPADEQPVQSPKIS